MSFREPRHPPRHNITLYITLKETCVCPPGRACDSVYARGVRVRVRVRVCVSVCEQNTAQSVEVNACLSAIQI